MESAKKVMVALAVLLTLTYGLSMAAAGVSIPGCGEGTPENLRKDFKIAKMPYFFFFLIKA